MKSDSKQNKYICFTKSGRRTSAFSSCLYLLHVLSDLLVSLPYWRTWLRGAHIPLLHEAVPAVEHGLVGCNRAPWRILRQNRGVRPSHLPQDVSAARLLLNLSMLRTRFLVRWRRQFLVRHLKWKWKLLWLLTVYRLLGMKTISSGKGNKSFVVCVKFFAWIIKTVAAGTPVPYSQIYNFVSRNGSWLALPKLSCCQAFTGSVSYIALVCTASFQTVWAFFSSPAISPLYGVWNWKQVVRCHNTWTRNTKRKLLEKPSSASPYYGLSAKRYVLSLLLFNFVLVLSSWRSEMEELKLNGNTWSYYMLKAFF